MAILARDLKLLLNRSKSASPRAVAIPPGNPEDEQRLPMKLTIRSLPPAVNHSHKKMRGRVFRSEETVDFRKAAATTALAEGIRPVGGLLSVSILLHERQHCPADVDARIKQAFDALNGIAWHDDRQIRRLAVEIEVDDKVMTEILIERYVARVTPESADVATA